jgi:hypothetical protein
MEAQIRKLATAASALVPLPRSRLRVVATDKRVGVVSGRILGSFVATALSHLLAQAPPGSPWQHTIFLMGAERLRDDVLDRLAGACESAGTGLVLGYRSIPARVRQRIGRGNAAVAFMRPGNAEDAKAASECIGTGHRFVLSRLTETVGASVTEATGISYPGTADGTAESGSMTAGNGASTAECGSITAGISAGTAWGASTSLATADSQALARALEHSREFLAGPDELQRLPPTAMIVSYATAAGRQVFIADANPAIGSLDAATMSPLAEAALVPAEAEAEAEAGAADPSWSGIAQPNLGPPSARLDWRKR